MTESDLKSGGYTPPTDEQLGNFVRVMLASHANRLRLKGFSAAHGADMVLRSPALKASWLEHHRQMQEGLRADQPRGKGAAP